MTADLYTGVLLGFLIAGLAGGLIGAVAAILWARRQNESKTEDAKPEAPRQEARRYFLMNETGNVLISTSLSPEGRLPDATLQLFSEALAHLACLFYAISSSTEDGISLYNYKTLKHALDWEPVFIGLSSSDNKPLADKRVRLFNKINNPAETEQLLSEQSTHEDHENWLNARVEETRSALGMDGSSQDTNRLRAIHSQMLNEAQRIQARAAESKHTDKQLFKSLQEPSSSDSEESSPFDTEHMEVAFITLNCECLMGVSLVSVKLSHAYYDEYLKQNPTNMEQDTYLFVSPSQLKNGVVDLNSLPRLKIGA